MGLCPFKGAKTPAMVALVRDVHTNQPKAIHRTAITLDGAPAIVSGEKRMALGPVAGGAVKLTPDEDVTKCLGVGEGIETTLSLRCLPEYDDGPVWAMLFAGNLGALPPLTAIECLWVAEDHDPAGKEASDKLTKTWCAAGREVLRVRAKAPKADLNDILKGETA